MEQVRLDFEALREAAAHERCLGCGAPAARMGSPMLAAGVDLSALEDYVPAWPLCDACASLERAVVRRARIAQVALAFAPPALGLAVAAAVPFALPLAPTVGVAIGAVVAWTALRASARRLSADLPVVVIRAEARTLEVARAPHEPPAGTGPYRRAAAPRSRRTGPVAIGGAGWACLLGVAVMGVSAWLVTGALYPRVRFDNGGFETLLVEIDGARTLRVGPRDQVDTSLRAGVHRLRVRGADEVTAGELVEVNLPSGSPHLLALEGEACFRVSRESSTRLHRWSNVAQVSTTSYVTRGRWIAVSAGASATRTTCDVDPLWPY